MAASIRIPTLVETGTCFGDTVFALRNDFRRIISIELDPSLGRRAQQRLASFNHISVYLGDSAELLPKVVGALSERALFFLDGHFSGGLTARGYKDTPILEELACVLADRSHDHIVVIDDARLFTGREDYPSTEHLSSFVRQRRPDVRLLRHTDLFVLLPASCESFFLP